MLRYPDSLHTLIFFQSDNLAAACKLVLDIMSKGRLSPVRDWQIPIFSGTFTSGLEQRLDILSQKSVTEDAPTTACFNTKNGDLITLSLLSGASSTCRVEFVFFLHESEDKFRDSIKRCMELCVNFLTFTKVIGGSVSRQGRLHSIPDVPIAKYNTHAIITSQKEVSAVYESTEEFWQADWQEISRFGDKILLSRAIEAATDLEYLKATWNAQWQMARHSNPGLARYFLLDLQADQKEFFYQEPSSLELIGYEKEQNLVKYSYHHPKEKHITGWEIYEIWRSLQLNILPDVHKVTEVQVYFDNEKSAQAEKRPLLDIGARVFYSFEGAIIEIKS